MKYSLKAVSVLMVLFLAACGSQISQPTKNTNQNSNQPQVLGITTLELGGANQGARAQAVTSDSAATFSTTPTMTNDVAGGVTYIKGVFTVTANQAFSNLTLYAVAQSGNLGGTALKEVRNFGNIALTDEAAARTVRPVHGMNAAGTAVVAGQEDLQFFAPAESLAVQAAARTAGYIGSTDRVLEYGYVARNSSGTRAFTNGGTGQITIAVKVPVVSAAADPYRFKITYVLVDEPISRVTRSIEEGTANITAATTRANALTGSREITFVGGPNGSLNACCKSIQLNNPVIAVPTGTLTSTGYMTNVTVGGGITGTISTPYVTAALGVPQNAEFAKNQVIVKFKPEANISMATRAMASTLNTEVDAIPLFDTTAVLEFGNPVAPTNGLNSVIASSNEADYTLSLLAQMRSRSDVLYAEPNYVRRKTQSATPPNDPLYPVQTTATADNNIWHYTQANVPNAWATTTGSSSVRIAILDTGILMNKDDTIGNNANNTREASTHPDLYCPDRWTPGYDFVSYTTTNTNPNQAIESDNPFDQGPYADTGYHGSHVAGTIGACTNNATGIAGINWTSQMQAVRVLGPLGGYTSDIVRGMRWAAGLPVLTRTPANPAGITITNPNPADILNESLGGPGVDQVTQDAIDDLNAAGKILVVAAGNENDDAYNYSPAGQNGVITVAALGPGSKRAYYSNFGSAVEIAAPGGDVQSATQPRLVLSIQGCNANGQGNVNPTTGCTTWGYGGFQGTSMASPHIAGIVGLMQAARVAASLPKLTYAQTLFYLQSTATAFPANNGCEKGCGAGQVDAAAAVTAAVGNAFNGPVLEITYNASSGTAGLDLGSNLTTGTLTLKNLTAVSGTFTLSGSNAALSTTAGTNTIAGNGTVTLNVTLDRSQSIDGSFIGSVSATTAAGQKASAPVLYVVGSGASNIGRMRIDLRNSGGTTLSRQIVNFVPGQGYLYRFVNVAAGSHFVVAAVDAANDGTAEYYRCYPQTDSSLCITGQTLAIGSAVRTDNFQIYPDAIGVAVYGNDPDPIR